MIPMIPSPSPAPESAVGPLVVTVASQSVVAFLVRLIPTLAPVLIVEAAVAPAFIGYLAAFGTVGSILFYLAGMPLIRRTGAVRIFQLGMLIAAAGCLMIAIPLAPVLALGSFLIGFGYAPSTPAGSDVLQRFAPPQHRALLFSIKQAGVPLGGVLAGVMLPPLALIDWRFAIFASVALTLLVAAAIQPMRARVDQGRNRSEDLSLAAFLAPENLLMPLHALRMSPRIPPLIFASFCLAAAQGASFAFLVTFFVSIGLNLTTAGAMFAIVQVTGIFGRILLGGLADRLGSATAMLTAAAFSSAVTTAIYAYAGPDWSYWSLALLAAVSGVTVSSWNGLMLAEVAAAVPVARIAEATAGTTLLVFLGYIAGPVGFALILDATASYRWAFLALTALTALGAAVLIATLRR
jgi:MFS family permease